MKKEFNFKRMLLAVLAMLAVGTMAFTSCSDDDKDDIEDIKGIINGGNGNVDVNIQDNGNSMTMVITGSSSTTTTVAKFDGSTDASLCTSYVETVAYNNKLLCDITWDTYQEIPQEEKDTYGFVMTRSGNTLTYTYLDSDDVYIGTPKSYIKIMWDAANGSVSSGSNGSGGSGSGYTSSDIPSTPGGVGEFE
ncbi:MAG: hypothetical protein J6K01_08955 [Paludibacteraceae bacterium]|nr:hypothetical protein [Paludibacteraceae bacterium]